MAKYWCKTCSVFVDDTKLGRSIHESSGKHKFLTNKTVADLNRKKKEEEKQAKIVDREIRRINKELNIKEEKKEAKVESTKGSTAYGYAQRDEEPQVDPEEEDKPTEARISEWKVVEGSTSVTTTVVAEKMKVPSSKRDQSASEQETRGWDLKQKRLDLEDLDDLDDIPVFKKRKPKTT